ncbi:ACT domain-containing protein, partial [Candidatus Bathyarchaeota archaeon]|nr:ACT domain-containing protein [Candidatus Bathyarchaeota archaeon]
IVVSQPQVLLHCQRFLRTHLQGVEQKPVSSTAEGAQIASKDPTFGAIGSERLAKIYNLNILSKEVHDNGINITRFAVVGLKPITPSDPAKTSLIIYPKVDQPGVLYSILGKFAEKKINLTRIASRPLGRAMGEYVFFIDFEGNLNDPRVRETLEQTKRLGIVESIRVLGSYSKSLPSVGESVVNPLIKEKKIKPFKLMEQTFEFWDNDEDRKYDLL